VYTYARAEISRTTVIMSSNNSEDQDDQMSPQESSDDTSSVESHTSSEPFPKNYMNLDEFLQAKGLNIGLPRRSCIIINTNKQLTGGNGALQINQQGDEGDDRSGSNDDMASNSSEESVSSNLFVPRSHHSLNLVGNNGDHAMSSGSGYASSFSSGGNGSISGYNSSSSANSATSKHSQTSHSKEKKKNEKSKMSGFSSDSGNGSSVCSSVKLEDSDRASSPEDPYQGVTMSSEDGSVSSLPANPALRRTNMLVRKRLQGKLNQGPESNHHTGNSSSSDDSTSGSTPVFFFDYQTEVPVKKRKRNVYHPSPPVKKSTKIHVPEEKKDAKYWERRQKNNLAAKRSREARRRMEMEIARRAQLLEDENKSLRDQVSCLRGKLDELRDRLTEKGDADIT